jgi:hypothetical protein
MAEPILADTRHTTTREAIRLAILQRITRGMLTYNSGRVHRLEGELWAVPSTRGGWHKVDLGYEVCDCEDFTFYGSLVGVACRHIYAAAIAAAIARARDQDDPDLRDQVHVCYSGVVYMDQLVIGEDGGEEEVFYPVLCRRCNPETL